jgi:hypothetical protein
LAQANPGRKVIFFAKTARPFPQPDPAGTIVAIYYSREAKTGPMPQRDIQSQSLKPNNLFTKKFIKTKIDFTFKG